MRRFEQVDVFTSGPLTGNPLAVVVDAEGLSTETMQSFARWTGLSETTFLLPATDESADYRVRIFTLDRELPFAGHPTLGSADVWLRSGGRPHDPERRTFVQECGAGLVQLRKDDRGAWSFAAPPLVRSGPLDRELTADLRSALELEPADVLDAAWADNGPGWAALLLADAARLADVRPDLSRWPRSEPLDVGLAALWPEADSEPDLEVRAFFEDHLGRLVEDPVTGSLNASLAVWLTRTGRLEAPYVARQGTQVGRAGRVEVAADDDGTLWIGGRVDRRVTGEVHLPAADG